MYDLLTKVSPAGLQAVGRAGDLMIVTRGPLLEPLIGVMHEAPKVVAEWCNRTSLAVNHGKVEVMECTKYYKWNRNCLLKMGNRNMLTRTAQSNWVSFLIKACPERNT